MSSKRTSTNPGRWVISSSGNNSDGGRSKISNDSVGNTTNNGGNSSNNMGNNSNDGGNNSNDGGNSSNGGGNSSNGGGEQLQ